MVALSAGEVILKYVCPGLGGIIAFFMFGAPMPAVLEVRRRRYIGETNALPFAAMGTNCLAWLFYGFLIRDWFVYIPNFVGLFFGWFYTFTCFRFSKDSAQETLIYILLGSATLYFVIGIVHQACDMSFAAAKTLWGSTAVGVLALYYVAPLTTMLKVVKDRDSESLNGPLCCMNVINGALWFSYGLAIKDYFIAMPNGIGAGLNVICILLCVIFPKKRTARQALAQLPAAAGAGPLRIQSAHFTPRPDEPPGGPAPAAGRLASFFDLTQMRWRSGGAAVGGAGAAAAAGSAADGGPGAAVVGASAGSLKWLLRKDGIAEGEGDVEGQQPCAADSSDRAKMDDDHSCIGVADAALDASLLVDGEGSEKNGDGTRREQDPQQQQ